MCSVASFIADRAVSYSKQDEDTFAGLITRILDLQVIFSGNLILFGGYCCYEGFIVFFVVSNVSALELLILSGMISLFVLLFVLERNRLI